MRLTMTFLIDCLSAAYTSLTLYFHPDDSVIHFPTLLLPFEHSDLFRDSHSQSPIPDGGESLLSEVLLTPWSTSASLEAQPTQLSCASRGVI